MRPAPFFILGAPRSGTSLLSRILNSHRNLAVPFETKIIENFHDMQSVFEPLTDPEQQRRLVEDILALPPMRDVYPTVDVERAIGLIGGPQMSDMMDGILLSWTQQQGKRRWGEKTPSNALYFDTLMRWFPDAQFVHIIRDGHDVAMSLKRAPFGPKTYFTAARRWREFVEICDRIGALLPSNRCMKISYEALLRETSLVLKNICDFLGEPFDDGMMDFYRDHAPYPTDSVNETNLHRPLIVNNIGKWRKELTIKKIEKIELAAGEMLKKQGYPVIFSAIRKPIRLELHCRQFIDQLIFKPLAMVKQARSRGRSLSIATIGKETDFFFVAWP